MIRERMKLFEIRDKATFIIVACCRLLSTNSADHYLLNRAGVLPTSEDLHTLMYTFSDGRSNLDPGCWNDRTYQTAHEYINKNWHELNSGDVIDIEFILGETKKPKISERNCQN